jgi:hypothetical protein
VQFVRPRRRNQAHWNHKAGTPRVPRGSPASVGRAEDFLVAGVQASTHLPFRVGAGPLLASSDASVKVTCLTRISCGSCSPGPT